jgi:hypothetical protein
MYENTRRDRRRQAVIVINDKDKCVGVCFGNEDIAIGVTGTEEQKGRETTLLFISPPPTDSKDGTYRELIRANRKTVALDFTSVGQIDQVIDALYIVRQNMVKNERGGRR